LPATAGAATKAVSMGEPSNVAQTFERHYNSDVNAFFPSGITIHVGDSVRFLPAGFHTVDIPARGSRAVPLVTPQGTNSGINDAAGQPFWFNGLPDLNFNPAVFGPGGLGKRLTYNGTQRVESGAPISARPQPMTVKFTKVGSYTYFCDVHAGMKGVVHVVAKKAKAPSAKSDAAAVKRQIAAAVKVAKRLAHTVAPTGTVYVGSAGPGGVEFYGFFPQAQTIPVGTTVRFAMSKGTFEDHTATTGPGDVGENGPGSGYLGDLANSFNSQAVDQRAVYPSDPSSTAAELTPTLHGNGFWNTGVMDGSNATPLPSSFSVKFAAPGTYVFHCLIHTFMKGTVTVK
jgi:plastocyanin